MSYYMRAEDADGNLLMGTEIPHGIAPGDQSYYMDREIERLGLRKGDKIKLYDLGNPTQTVEVEDGDDSSERADGSEPGNGTDGPVQPNE